MDNKTMELPAPRAKGELSFEEAALNRRSVRTFSKKGLTAAQTGQLLWAAQGITARRAGLGFRTAPSAGALYPFETYAVTADGVFIYKPAGHALEKTLDGDRRGDLAAAALGQGPVASAPLDIVLCAVFSRITGRYGQRGVRYAHIEAGHIAQNIHLQAVALGLGSVPVGAFDDGKVSKALSLPRKCEPLYIIPVGHARQRGGRH